MPGVTPNEGETLIANLVYKGADVDRGTSLQIGLFTNISGLNETSVLADIIEPSTAGGYSRKTLTDASWSVTDGVSTYTTQTFTAVGANFSAPIYGYFIATTGTTPRLLHFEVEGTAITVADGESYAVDINNIYD